MARFINLGNGELLIGLDSYGQVRDLYFPYVGLENHVDGHYVHRIGVWVDNRFSWIDDGSWKITQNYIKDTMASYLLAVNPHLQIQLDLTDTVYNEKNIFLRKVVLKNLADSHRKIKFYFHQEFEIYQARRGDTAYYDSQSQTVIHYKGRRVFLINALHGDKSFDDYSVGLFNIEGKEGTYKDAEDGQLSQNPIEHGMVDSVIGLTCDLRPHQSDNIYYWLCASKQFQEVFELNSYVHAKTPQYLIKSAQDFWKAWVNRQHFNFTKLPPHLVDLFKKSLFIIRSHTDNRGAVIASGDSDLLKYGRDTYSYVWPRDAAYCTLAMDRAGDLNLAKRFFEFANEIISPDGYFMHKYRADRSLGSSWHPWVRHGHPQLPIQEDETALVIYAFWQHYLVSLDLEFIESLYNSLIKKAADFMVAYRDPTTGLPRESYDLWEERYGIFTYTTAVVYAALNCAAKFAKLLGKTDGERKYEDAASEIKSAALKYLYNPDTGLFYKSITFSSGQPVSDPTPDMSTAYGIFKFGLLPPDDPRFHPAFMGTAQKLTLPTSVGGFARYEGDMYFRSSDHTPGNPWIITSLWLAQYHLSQAKNEADLRPVLDWLEWVAKSALPTGILPEQLHAHTGSPLSATPLAWSHAEYVTTVLQYLDKLESLGISPSRLAPK